MKKYLAIDLGASSGRGIVGTLDGGKLYLKENSRFDNEPVMVQNRLYWDILRIYNEIKKSIRQTALDGDDIVSIGIDTWGVDYGLIDKSGKLMSNPVHYRDARNQGAANKILDEITFKNIYNATGIQFLNFNTLFQLRAELQDDNLIFEKVDKVLFVPDLLNYFLTDKMATEYTVASTGAILDARKQTISNELLTSVGISSRLFAHLVKPGNRLGSLAPKVCQELGTTDIAVVNVASHDTASAVISVPNTKGDILYISSGTWSLMGTEIHEPVITDASMAENFTNEGGYAGKIRFLKNIMGLWILQESRRQWRREGKEYSFAQLEQLARQAKPFAAFIDPDNEMFSAPGDMPKRVVDFCQITGQYVPQNVGEIVRCIYESLVLKYRKVAERIISLTGISPKVLNIVGGGSKDELLNQMTADACNIKVVAGPGEATAIGNIIVQAIADGEICSVEQGRQVIQRSFELKEFDPVEPSAWDEAYISFEKIFDKIIPK